MDAKINTMYERGVKLFISGEPATPVMVSKLMARKVSKCMPKFFFNKEGRLLEINFI